MADFEGVATEHTEILPSPRAVHNDEVATCIYESTAKGAFDSMIRIQKSSKIYRVL